MSLYERRYQGYFRADRIGRTPKPPRDHNREVDPEFMRDNPPLPYWIPKPTPEEIGSRMNAARQFSRALDSLMRATPEDIQNRMREQDKRRAELQKSGELGHTWKQRRSPSKRPSYQGFLS